MGHGLGPDSDSELSDAPASPSSTQVSLPIPESGKADVPPQPAPAESLPPFKARSSQPLRPTKRQPSISHPQPPSSPKRRKQTPKNSSPPLSPPPPNPVSGKRASARRVTKRSNYVEDGSSGSEADEQVEKPKRRRKSNILPKTGQTLPSDAATSKFTHKRSQPRALKATQTSSPAKHEKKDLQPLDPRPASFLTCRPSFLARVASAQPANGGTSLQPKADNWSCEELNGLTWARLNIPSGSLYHEDKGEGACWWPAEITEKTLAAVKLAFCSIKLTLEVETSALSVANILTFRQPNSSTVRFPTFKSAYSPSAAVPEDTKNTAPSTQASAPLSGPKPDSSRTTSAPASVLPADPISLEPVWKASLTRAFGIDAESNDGLEDIFLLLSQKSKGAQDDSSGSGDTILEDEDGNKTDKTDEGDVLEDGTVVLCRYRTRYYPAQVIAYYPREGRRRRGRYRCRFADDSTRIATRDDIFTTLEEQFVTCPLGSYQRYVVHDHTAQKQRTPASLRAPTPEPRVSSPEPEPSDAKIDSTEYCARERMRDQLRPVLPFLQGIIERTYGPVQGRGRTDGAEDVLDRHAVFMQGGRARQALAYSVHTGDINEDDCEELLFEISRWALRGERWADRVNMASSPTDDEYAQKGKQETLVQNGQEAGSTREKGEEAHGLDAKATELQKDGKLADGVLPTVSEKVVEMEDVGDDAGSNPTVGASPEGAEARESSGVPSQIDENVEPRRDKQTSEHDHTDTTLSTAFQRLVQLQPPRPTGTKEYEELTPEERMGYVSDVLYPEAAAFILSFRRGVRTHPGPLSDPAAEYNLYAAGIQAAKNTVPQENWVDQILAIRQLREANSRRHCMTEEETQVIVPGGTKSRPKYMPSKTGSVLK